MYLHLGQSVVIREDDIIGFFDLDNTTSSHITRKFLGEAEKARRVVNVSDDMPNAFIVCGKPVRTGHLRMGGGEVPDAGSPVRVYLSQMSPQILVKRMDTMGFA